MSTKKISIGNVIIGGGNDVIVQSMTTTKASMVSETIEQIAKLERAGCQIVRVTVPDVESAQSIDKIKEKINIPLVADIHFDYKLALMCIERGIDKIRINPGNIGLKSNVLKVADAANKKNIPIRIGVNSGSIDKKLLAQYNGPTVDAMVKSALQEIEVLHECDFTNIVLSLKASDVTKTVSAYKKISEYTDYPLHIGVTEAGSEYSGLVKSSVGLGSLLLDGIGDTMRVSLTADPVKEIYAAKEILKACGRLNEGVTIISCPTCGRCSYNLIDIVNKLEKEVTNIKKKVKVAVMGCIVNGPGEAKDADFGVAGGDGECIFFKNGAIERKIPYNCVVDELINEIEKF